MVGKLFLHRRKGECVPVRIAITGEWGSGKTTALKILSRKKETDIFNSDSVVHNYYKSKDSEVYKKFKKSFPYFIDKDGNIDLNRLKRDIFKSNRIKILEGIVHPYVIKDLKEWFNNAKAKFLIAEVPLLFEKKLDSLFDFIITIYVPSRIQMERLRKLGISSSQIRERKRNLLPMEYKLEHSHFVIDNGGSLEDFKKSINRVWLKIRNYRK